MKFIQNFKAEKGNLYNFYHNVMTINDRFDKHHTFMLASGIAFNLIIYVIPLFLLVIYIMKVVFDLDSLKLSIGELLADFLPPTSSNAEFVQTIMTEVNLITEHAAFFGWIGAAGLLWISSFFISSIRTSLNTIFEVEVNRFFMVYWLKDIFLTIIISVLILLYSYANPIINFFVDLVSAYSPAVFEGFLSSVILTSSSILTSFILFLFIFRIVPNSKLPRYVVLLSTGMCVVAIELARYLFAWYISSVSNYGKFYGTYAVIMALAVWIYYSSLIILLSAEISKFIYDKKNVKIEPKL
ncbi:MAG: YihY/virulence factor BrkB family protein [Candidatus Kapabacteria bacterium]|nr:YihY/virulence factor BrkB family protein [Candidatus Kapabacteria bacterium]